MDIRKIIKEEIDDFDWAEKVPKGMKPEKGMTFTMYSTESPSMKGGIPLECVVLIADGSVISYRAKTKGGFSFKSLMGNAVFKSKVISGEIVVH